MQLIVVNETEDAQHHALIEAMLRLRAKVFAGRLSWKVDSRNGLERDAFDDQGPTYIIAVASHSQVVGCVRLLPPMRSSMLNEVFPDLLEGGLLPVHERMIESSRFCIDKDVADLGGLEEQESSGGPRSELERRGGTEGATMVRVRTRMLLAGIVEWSLAHGYDELVTATDLRFERLLKMVGWPLQRLGSPQMINETHSVAGSLVISNEIFQSLKPEGYRSLFDRSAIRG